jgi:hypothetical protein
MSSADRYATLSEIWGADSQYGQPVTTSTYNLTSPTCNPGSGGAGAAPTQQPWCDLYNNGYNREVDSIMDMYTPGDSIPADVRYDPKKGKGGVLGPGLSGPLCFSDGDKETILPFEMSMYSAGLSYAPFEVRSSSKKNMSRDSSCRNNKGRRGEDNEDADDVTTERDDEYNDEFQKSSKYRSSRRNQIVENDFDLDFDQLNQYATYQAGPKRCAPRKERSVTNPNTTTTTTTPTNTNTTNTNTTNTNTNTTNTTNITTSSTTSTPTSTNTSNNTRAPKSEGFYNNDDLDDNDDEDEIVQIRGHRSGQHSGQRQVQQQPTCYLDIALYFLSGVILIFVLEQFVQLGLHMR